MLIRGFFQQVIDRLPIEGLGEPVSDEVSDGSSRRRRKAGSHEGRDRRVDTLPRDRGIRVTLGDDRIAMFRIGDEVFAVGDRCSHAEASLAEGEVFDHEVECPRHGSEFDLRTGAAVVAGHQAGADLRGRHRGWGRLPHVGGIVTTALDVRGLSAAVEGKQILEGLDLVVPFGEVHALMGPNGSGSPPCATC